METAVILASVAFGLSVLAIGMAALSVAIGAAKHRRAVPPPSRPAHLAIYPRQSGKGILRPCGFEWPNLITSADGERCRCILVIGHDPRNHMCQHGATFEPRADDGSGVVGIHREPVK